MLGAAQAQMRGGFAGHVGGMRGGFVGRAPIAPRGMPAAVSRGGVPAGAVAVRRGFVPTHGAFGLNRFTFCRFGRCFAQPVFRGGFRHHNRIFFGFGFGGFSGFPFFNSWAFGWPYYGAPAYYGDYAASSASVYNDMAERERLLNDLEDERRRADELRMELADLQGAANAAARTATAPPMASAAPSATEQPTPTTTLVFRDNRRLDVQNYAIVGDRLYEFGPHWKRTISLSDLDLPATVKANEDRGIRFELPSKASKRR